MYERFFGLRENPFKLSPDLKYFLVSGRVERVLDQLFYGLEQGMGFMMITGPVGVGKTSLLRYFMSLLDERVERAYLFNPNLGDGEELLFFLLRDLGVNGLKGRRKWRKVELLERLQGYLLERYRQGKRVLFIVDDAQAAPYPILEELRLLSNFETEEEKLFQILLVGQPELEERIKEDLPQLYQRIAIRAHLAPLDREETVAYVHHRIASAGGNPTIFSSRGLKALWKASRGIPRLINLIADRALLAGFVRNSRTIGRKEVKMAVKDLEEGG